MSDGAGADANLIDEPARPDNPKIGERKHSAVGIPAIAHSMQYALTEMGAVRSARTLLRMNHIDGFDCPSCAWPDPDRRKAAEFWAAARKAGTPTAGPQELDGDVILAAQAVTLGDASFVVATSNVGHLARFVPAELWQNIIP